MPKKKTASKKKSVGRPTKYSPSHNEQVAKLCRLGATDKQLADFFNISESTLNNWKLKEPEFMESLKEGKIVADAEVADSLYNRAMGFSHTDTKFATFEGKITDSKEFTKHYPPDSTGCIFWLKNRAGWKDSVALTDEEGGNLFTKLAETLKEAAKS